MADEFVFAGQTIAGKYRLESRLGRGGMGEVWRAQHLLLRAPVAVKFINPSLATSGDANGRFLREAQAAAALRSPHVVQILDYGVDEHLPFMVLEFLEGESLGASITRQGRLTPEETPFAAVTSPQDRPARYPPSWASAIRRSAACRSARADRRCPWGWRGRRALPCACA